VSLSRTVLVTGFSQGGQAAMATGRALQEHQSHDRWRLGALAPIAGPFDLRNGLASWLDPRLTDPANATAFLAYLLTAWKPLYRLYDNPSEVFTAPYAQTVENLFDGQHSTPEVLAALPSTPADLLLPATIADLARPTGRLAAALRANETCHWAPDAPTRLYAAHGDRDAVFAHAERCRDQLRAHGGHAEIVDMGDADHFTTALLALPLIRTWFEDLAAAR
jgi:hypothetical protein